MNYAIQTHGLCYQYSSGVQILKDINLQVPKGSIYGFLGPNGSGKTTTLCLLLGLLGIQKGNIELFGKPLHEDRVATLKRIGSLIETPSLYGHLSAVENLEVYRRIYGSSKQRAIEVLEITGLGAVGAKKARQFSLGMKQRLSIAMALLPSPELLILDEPSNGLDPNGILELRELIRTLNSTYGMTILISSHILAEVEKMVSHVGIIYKGTMLFQGGLDELYAFRQHAAKLLVSTSDNAKAAQLLSAFAPQMHADILSVVFHDLSEVGEVARILVNSGLDVHLLQPKKQELEQLFMELTSQHHALI
jgi:ABC-type multidrug transport system ATPase subunit